MVKDKIPTRRQVLKGVGAGAISLGAGSTTVLARTSTDSPEIPDHKMLNELLEEAGNPKPVSSRTVVLGETDQTSENRMVATEVRTTNGVLGYTEIDAPSGTQLLPGYFRFDERGGDIPKQYRNALGPIAITLVYEEGTIHPRRGLMKAEKRAVQDVIDVDGDATMIYNASSGEIFVLASEETRFTIAVDRVGRASYLQRPVTPALKTGRYEVDEGPVEILGDDCFDLFGPCTACIAGTAACAVCGITCATGPQCAACLILTCGFAGGACGCCAMCADGIPDPENVFCPD